MVNQETWLGNLNVIQSNVFSWKGTNNDTFCFTWNRYVPVWEETRGEIIVLSCVDDATDCVDCATEAAPGPHADQRDITTQTTQTQTLPPSLSSCSPFQVRTIKVI